MRTLLIDADIPIHRFAHVNQYASKWDADTWTYFCDMGHAKAQFKTWLSELRDLLWADAVELYLSDSERNWRHGLMPEYKGHRATWQEVKLTEKGELPPPEGPQRPLLYKPLRVWALEHLGAHLVSGLEADDLLGLAATDPVRGDDERVIVTIDKDLRTVPGLHFNPDKPGSEVDTVDEKQALYNHYYLTLVGDPADGYKGCPRVGPKTAQRLLQDDCVWPTVVEAYEKGNLTAEDALRTARIARVLQHGDYDWDTKEIQLWQPTR